MRDTKELTLPKSEKKVVIKTWMSGGEWQEMQNEMLQGMKINPQQPQSSEFDVATMAKANEKALNLLVVSVDGKEENCVEALKEMHVADYRFVIDEINKITQETTNEKEKKSTGK